MAGEEAGGIKKCVQEVTRALIVGAYNEFAGCWKPAKNETNQDRLNVDEQRRCLINGMENQRIPKDNNRPQHRTVHQSEDNNEDIRLVVDGPQKHQQERICKITEIK